MYTGQQPLPPNYVMLGNQYGAPPPPGYYPQYPHRRAVPRYEGRRSGNFCIRCICCCYFLLFLFIFLSAFSLFLTYSFYKPEMPRYKIQDFNVKTFNVNFDMTVNTEFLVTVRAENPNTKIGFIYGRGSSVTVLFEDSVLCTGKLPAFHQGHQNVTVVDIPLSGKSPFGLGLFESLQNSEQQGQVQLLVKVKAPISVVLDHFPLRQFVFFIDCVMVVDDLKPNKKPKILSTVYTFNIGY